MCDLVSWGRCDVVAGYRFQNCRPAAVALVLGRYYRSTAAGAGCWGSTAAVLHLGPAAVAVLLQYKEGGGYCFGGCFCVPQCSDRYCHNYHDCTDSMGGVAGRAGNGYKPLVAVASWPVVCCVDGHIVARCMQGPLRPCILMHKAPKKIKPSTLSLPSHFGLHMWLFHTVAAVLVE